MEPVDPEFEKELQQFKQRMEASSMWTLLRKQMQQEKRMKEAQNEIDVKTADAEDLTKMSASQKRKIKKKAKQLAEQLKQKE